MLYRNMYDKSLALGEDFDINPKIKIYMPTVREIIEFGEQKYYSIVYAFASTASDYKAQLDDEGVDWQSVSDYELFQRLFVGLRSEDLSIVFGDMDMREFKIARDELTGEIVFRNEKMDAVIDRMVYECISDYICAVHKLEKNTERAENEYTRQLMIEEARGNLAAQRNQPFEPHLRRMVCAMANTPEFKADYFGALNYPVSVFMDCVRQVQQLKHFNYVMQGIYAGTVDMKKIPKSQLNWLKGPPD